MISAKPMAMVAMLVLAGAVVAQEKVDEQRIAELIEQLENENTRENAADKLVVVGERAVKSLLDVVERKEHPIAREAFLTLARMQPQADVIVPRLLSIPMDSLRPRALPAFYRALAELTPYAVLDWDKLVAIESTVDFILDDVYLVPSEIPPGSRAQFLRELVDEAFRLLGRIALIMPPEKTRITVAPAQREVELLNFALIGSRLLAMEGEFNFNSVEPPTADGTILAAELLGHRGSEARIALPTLRYFLLNTDPRTELPINTTIDHRDECAWLAIRVLPDKLAELESGLAGESKLIQDAIRRVPFTLEVKTAVAAAMERIAPEDPAIAIAVAHRLLHHPDASERADAARVLGGFGEEAAEAVPFLVEALKTDQTHASAEAITALGMIGPAAKDAIPILEKLAEHDNPQIAERAKAALRQVRGGFQEFCELPTLTAILG